MSATGKAAQIPDALLAKLATLAIGSPPLPIAMPGIAFDPALRCNLDAQGAPDGKYLEATYFPNRPAWEGVSSGVMDQGLLQITVHWPRGAGIIAPMEVVERVKTHFAKGTVLASGATQVKLHRAPWAAAPLIEPTEVCIPVSIDWRA